MASGLPIRDFDKLLAQLQQMNQVWAGVSQTITDIHELLKPETIEETEMPIPLRIKPILGTGLNFGEDIPFQSFINANSDWQTILQNTIDSDMVPKINGHKLIYLDSYQPGSTYQFNVAVDQSFTDFNSLKTNPIEVFLIDTNLQHAASDFLQMLAISIGVFSVEQFIPDFIAYSKRKGWVGNLSPTGGSFAITPGNSDRLIHFSAHTSANGGQGCVITNYNATTQTFTIGGY